MAPAALAGGGPPALLSVAQWAYYSLVDSHHENCKALELLLRAVLQQVAVSLLLRCQDRLWVIVGQVAQAPQGSGLQSLGWAGLCGAPSKDLDAVTTVLPVTTIPFSQHFPGPDPATLRWVHASLHQPVPSGWGQGCQ